MTAYEVDSIGVASLAKILGVMGFLWGLLMAILSLFVWGLGGMMGVGGGFMGTGFGMMGGAGLLVWLVIGPLYGVIAGAITAIVYNAAASLIGGIELELA